MPRTLQDIQVEIRRLEKQRAAIIEREVAGVIERIKVAIAHYDLTPQQLFGKPTQRKPKSHAARRGIANAAAAPQAGVIRFQDAEGNSWTGRGRRPKWYLDALAAGKTADDLRVRRA